MSFDELPNSLIPMRLTRQPRIYSAEEFVSRPPNDIQNLLEFSSVMPPSGRGRSPIRQQLHSRPNMAPRALSPPRMAASSSFYNAPLPASLRSIGRSRSPVRMLSPPSLRPMGLQRQRAVSPVRMPSPPSLRPMGLQRQRAVSPVRTAQASSMRSDILSRQALMDVDERDSDSDMDVDVRFTGKKIPVKKQRYHGVRYFNY